MKLRVGIIGLGEAWESRHKPALRTLSDRFEVRAVCSEVAHLASQAARDFQAAEVDGFRSLCSRDDVDVVFILSPEWYGPLPILAACDYGKSVFCGAALDIADPADARQLKARVEQAGIAFMAEFPRRLAPATLRLKELIATRLGKPKLLFCHRRSPIEPEGSPQRPRRLLPHDAARNDRAGRLVPLCRGRRADLGHRHRAQTGRNRATATIIR